MRTPSAIPSRSAHRSTTLPAPIPTTSETALPRPAAPFILYRATHPNPTPSLLRPAPYLLQGNTPKSGFLLRCGDCGDDLSLF